LKHEIQSYATQASRHDSPLISQRVAIQLDAVQARRGDDGERQR
jgi:hypothetical protein